MKMIDVKGIIKFLVMVLGVFTLMMWLSSCSSFKNKSKTETTTTKDSIVFREYDVPVKIKEQTIKEELSLDSLCKELEAIKADLRAQRSAPRQVIYRDTDRSSMIARIDSLGRLLLESQAKELDTLIKGQEQIRVRTEKTTKTKQKEKTVKPSIMSWWLLILIGIAIGYFLPKIISFSLRRLP